MKNLLRKTVSLILVVLLLNCIMTIGVSAVTTDKYEYTIENNVATITKYLGNEDNVIVPAKIDGYDVKSISFYAFMDDNSSNIKSVVVSEGIEFVGNWLFTESKNIESITLPSSITELPTDWFFIGSSKLKEIKFSGNNERYYVKDGVLYDSHSHSLMICPALNTFENGTYKIIDGTEKINGWAFSNCLNIKKVVMPNTLKFISDHALSSCENLSEIILSDKIDTLGYNSFGNLTNLKDITIPKNVTGFYYKGESTNTYLGYIGSSKIEGFTIRGYKNSEAEKYAKENGFIFIALDEDIDYSQYNPFDFIGKTLDEITDIFGANYTEVEERESGSTMFIGYPNTGNPFEFGFDYNTKKVKYIYIYDLTNTPIKLFDDITNKSNLKNIENSNTSYKYDKWIGENPFDDNNIEQTVTYNINNGIIVSFNWTFNDFNTEPANMVLIMQGNAEETTENNQDTTNVQSTTKSTENIKITTSSNTTTNVSSADTATKDTISNDNGFIQTGVVPLTIVIIILLGSLTIGFFAWNKRRIN